MKTAVPQPKQQFSYTLQPTVLPTIEIQVSNEPPTIYAVKLIGSPLQTSFSPSTLPLEKNLLFQVLPNTSSRYLITPGQVQPKNKRRLAAHKRNLHGSKEIRKSVMFFKCIVCSKGFNTRKRLATHLEDVHFAYEDMECQDCQKLIWGPKRMKQHIQSHHFTYINEDNNPLACKICKKVFIKAVNLASHIKIHETM